MKFLSLLFVGVSVLTATAHAGERIKYQAVIRAELKAEGESEFVGGSLYQNGVFKDQKVNGQLSVTLQPKMPTCPEDQMCIQVMPEPISYTLNGTVSRVDHCGIITTRAFVDNRPSDGKYLAITVRNNLSNKCPTFVALKPLVVEVRTIYYSRLEARKVSTFDRFVADDVALIKPVLEGKGSSVKSTESL